MPENPYSPPGTELKDQPEKPGSLLKAFVVGLVIDIGGTLVAGILLAIAYSVLLANSGRSPEQITAALQDLSPTSTLGIISATIGCALSVLGGFACARIARSTDYKLGSMLAATSTCIGLLMTGDNGSLALNLAMAAATAVCVLLGTRLGMSRAGA